MKPILRAVLLVAVLASLLLAAHHYVPFQPLVAVVYAGLVTALAGLVSVVRPVRLLGIRTRRAGAGVLLAGGAVAIAGLSWPAPTLHAAAGHQRIDDFLPAYEFYEVHETEVAATPEQVGRAVREVSFADMPVAVALMRVRAMAAGHFSAPPISRIPLLEIFARPGSNFLPLDASCPGEYVGGMAGRPWAARARPSGVKTPAQFLAFQAPGNVKVAFNMRWSPAGAGRTRVTTETRIKAIDDEARRTFARYWRVIYPGSAIIRRVWLDAIVARAEHARSPGH
jgi:hypothetical protein